MNQAAKALSAAADTRIMNEQSTNKSGDTVRIRRPARVTTDELGRTRWMGDVDPCALDVVNEVATDPYNSTITELPPFPRA